MHPGQQLLLGFPPSSFLHQAKVTTIILVDVLTRGPTWQRVTLQGHVLHAAGTLLLYSLVYM